MTDLQNHILAFLSQRGPSLTKTICCHVSGTRLEIARACLEMEALGLIHRDNAVGEGMAMFTLWAAGQPSASQLRNVVV
jgi:hypothetical protein